MPDFQFIETSQLKKVIENIIDEKRLLSNSRPREILTIKELSKRLKISTAKIYQLRREEELPVIVIGGNVRYDLDEILNFFNSKNY